MLVLATMISFLTADVSAEDIIAWPKATKFLWNETLGLPAHADLKSAQAAWRTLAKKYHPDQGGSEEKMVRVNAAYKAAKDKLR
jgi:DnaJ-class molecular chaperone